MTQTNESEAKDAEAVDPLPQQEEFYRPPARFGSIPVEAEPLGWDRQRGFRRHYPPVNLPTQIVDRVSLGMTEPHEPNRLIWGDNLHVMRQIPSNSIDLIYIDPPFFSGRQYNVMWGDANEMRSFNDIWEGGMTGYLIWLNARLYEMKRLLKPTGSIYVHCDWHASHYIKIEMDKIFGYDNFVNEVVWCYEDVGGKATNYFKRKHDAILMYRLSGSPTFWVQRKGLSESTIKRYAKYFDDNGQITYRSLRDSNPGVFRKLKGIPDDLDRVWLDVNEGAPLNDWWSDISTIKRGFDESIGYPTQKPETLLERIIKASSNEGDVVLDAFVGGGTAIAVAQQLGRRFIGCDQSRVAIAVTAERLKQQAVKRGIEDQPIPDFSVEHWGIYEADQLSQMPFDQFHDFVLRSYGATRNSDEGASAISGWRNQTPIWVGASGLDSQATAQDVEEFANSIRRTVEYRDANLRDGVMLSWGFTQGAQEAANKLKQRQHIDVNFVRLKQVRIGDADFREHIVRRSTDRADYGELLTFVQPPVISVAYKTLGGLSVTLDAGDSIVMNSGAEIVNVQWDFDYNWQSFKATPGYSFRDYDKKLLIKVTHKFPRSGSFSVGCRVQDSRGGEGMWNGEVKVK